MYVMFKKFYEVIVFENKIVDLFIYVGCLDYFVYLFLL